MKRNIRTNPTIDALLANEPAYPFPNASLLLPSPRLSIQSISPPSLTLSLPHHIPIHAKSSAYHFYKLFCGHSHILSSTHRRTHSLSSFRSYSSNISLDLSLSSPNAQRQMGAVSYHSADLSYLYHHAPRSTR